MVWITERKNTLPMLFFVMSILSIDYFTKFTKAIELKPSIAEPYNERGYAYNRLGNYQQAIEDLNERLKSNQILQ